LQDEWSSIEDLPPYRPTNRGAATAVVLPLASQTVPGVIFLECSRRIRRTEVSSGELTRLANAISILFDLYRFNRTQSRCTQAAIDELSELVAKRKFPKTTLPHVFVAFSGRADPEVTSAIRQILDEYSTRVEVTDWAQIYDSGSISAQITREISESALGICYFSEPTDAEGIPGHEYQDNANVIFEAGMLHLRTSTSSADGENEGQPRGWIPIREAEPSSPPPPFDFQSERILMVPRDTSGKFLSNSFQGALRLRLDKLLSTR